MAFKNPHVSLASVSVDSSLDGTTDILVIETDLHLNKRHSDYDFSAVQQLLRAAREYLASNPDQVTHIRLISNRSGQISPGAYAATPLRENEQNAIGSSARTSRNLSRIFRAGA
jgi:hypothetical protein